MIEKPPHDFRGMLDNVFRTVQLITLQVPADLNSSPNYQLQIARLAVPVVAVLATFQVLIASITRPARLALLPYTSGHIVVCGSAQITQSAQKLLPPADNRSSWSDPTQAIETSSKDSASPFSRATRCRKLRCARWTFRAPPLSWC